MRKKDSHAYPIKVGIHLRNNDFNLFVIWMI
jgi:hypothetical protein